MLGKENFSSTLFLIYPKSSNNTKADILKKLNCDPSGNPLDSSKMQLQLDIETVIFLFLNKKINVSKGE